jgi:hypothetical protein
MLPSVYVSIGGSEVAVDELRRQRVTGCVGDQPAQGLAGRRG